MFNFLVMALISVSGAQVDFSQGITPNVGSGGMNGSPLGSLLKSEICENDQALRAASGRSGHLKIRVDGRDLFDASDRPACTFVYSREEKVARIEFQLSDSQSERVGQDFAAETEMPLDVNTACGLHPELKNLRYRTEKDSHNLDRCGSLPWESKHHYSLNLDITDSFIRLKEIYWCGAFDKNHISVSCE